MGTTEVNYFGKLLAGQIIIEKDLSALGKSFENGRDVVSAVIKFKKTSQVQYDLLLNAIRSSGSTLQTNSSWNLQKANDEIVIQPTSSSSKGQLIAEARAPKKLPVNHGQVIISPHHQSEENSVSQGSEPSRGIDDVEEVKGERIRGDKGNPNVITHEQPMDLIDQLKQFHATKKSLKKTPPAPKSEPQKPNDTPNKAKLRPVAGWPKSEGDVNLHPKHDKPPRHNPDSKPAMPREKDGKENNVRGENKGGFCLTSQLPADIKQATKPSTKPKPTIIGNSNEIIFSRSDENKLEAKETEFKYGNGDTETDDDLSFNNGTQIQPPPLPPTPSPQASTISAGVLLPTTSAMVMNNGPATRPAFLSDIEGFQLSSLRSQSIDTDGSKIVASDPMHNALRRIRNNIEPKDEEDEGGNETSAEDDWKS